MIAARGTLNSRLTATKHLSSKSSYQHANIAIPRRRSRRHRATSGSPSPPDGDNKAQELQAKARLLRKQQEDLAKQLAQLEQESGNLTEEEQKLVQAELAGQDGTKPPKNQFPQPIQDLFDTVGVTDAVPWNGPASGIEPTGSYFENPEGADEWDLNPDTLFGGKDNDSTDSTGYQDAYFLPDGVRAGDTPDDGEGFPGEDEKEFEAGEGVEEMLKMLEEGGTLPDLQGLMDAEDPQEFQKRVQKLIDRYQDKYRKKKDRKLTPEEVEEMEREEAWEPTTRVPIIDEDITEIRPAPPVPDDIQKQYNTLQHCSYLLRRAHMSGRPDEPVKALASAGLLDEEVDFVDPMVSSLGVMPWLHYMEGLKGAGAWTQAKHVWADVSDHRPNPEYSIIVDQFLNVPFPKWFYRYLANNAASKGKVSDLGEIEIPGLTVVHESAPEDLSIPIQEWDPDTRAPNPEGFGADMHGFKHPRSKAKASNPEEFGINKHDLKHPQSKAKAREKSDEQAAKPERSPDSKPGFKNSRSKDPAVSSADPGQQPTATSAKQERSQQGADTDAADSAHKDAAQGVGSSGSVCGNSTAGGAAQATYTEPEVGSVAWFMAATGAVLDSMIPDDDDDDDDISATKLGTDSQDDKSSSRPHASQGDASSGSDRDGTNNSHYPNDKDGTNDSDYPNDKDHNSDSGSGSGIDASRDSSEGGQKGRRPPSLLLAGLRRVHAQALTDPNIQRRMQKMAAEKRYTGSPVYLGNTANQLLPRTLYTNQVVEDLPKGAKEGVQRQQAAASDASTSSSISSSSSSSSSGSGTHHKGMPEESAVAAAAAAVAAAASAAEQPEEAQTKQYGPQTLAEALAEWKAESEDGEEGSVWMGPSTVFLPNINLLTQFGDMQSAFADAESASSLTGQSIIDLIAQSGGADVDLSTQFEDAKSDPAKSDPADGVTPSIDPLPSAAENPQSGLAVTSTNESTEPQAEADTERINVSDLEKNQSKAVRDFYAEHSPGTPVQDMAVNLDGAQVLTPEGWKPVTPRSEPGFAWKKGNCMTITTTTVYELSATSGKINQVTCGWGCINGCAWSLQDLLDVYAECCGLPDLQTLHTQVVRQ